ncbi:MAG: hypothetical protein Q9191_005647 [Dirinaria sp. TL-2023a]
MSVAATGSTPAALKVLLLHGYTQSGPLFSAKSRALHKALQKSFSPRPVQFSYPTGPHRLMPTDVPDYGPPDPDGANIEDVEAFGWWIRKDTDDGIIYRGIDQGMAAIARCIEEDGPFEGVIGFSQGAAAAAMVASLLEGNERFNAFAKAENEGGIPYPSTFKAYGGFVQQPLKFAIVYSGFRAPGKRYEAFYEPRIETPVLHFLGQLDSVVEEDRSRALVAACEAGEKNVVIHPGGHFLPSQRPWLDACVNFVKSCTEQPAGRAGKEQEDDINDLDVPF